MAGLPVWQAHLVGSPPATQAQERLESRAIQTALRLAAPAAIVIGALLEL
jgi:hypothetical protein